MLIRFYYEIEAVTVEGWDVYDGAGASPLALPAKKQTVESMERVRFYTISSLHFFRPASLCHTCILSLLRIVALSICHA
jgi:hypothetical protein